MMTEGMARHGVRWGRGGGVASACSDQIADCRQERSSEAPPYPVSPQGR